MTRCFHMTGYFLCVFTLDEKSWCTIEHKIMNWANQIQTLELVQWCFQNVKMCKKKNQSRIMACAKDSNMNLFI
jgi:hypothetical protein